VFHVSRWTGSGAALGNFEGLLLKQNGRRLLTRKRWCGAGHPSYMPIKTALLVLCSLLAFFGFSFAQNKTDLSLGWTFQASDQGTGFANLNGWYGTLTWEASQRVGVSFQHQDFWGGYLHSGVNQHVWLAGATVKLREGNPRVSPFVQPLAGGTRSSSSGTVQWEPTFQIAGGADIKLRGNLSLELIPAEYAYTHGNSGNLNSYEAAAGLQYSFGK
jgi:hypothetical protein